MSITDELREYVGNFYYLFRYKDVREKLTAIADRIDAEHEKAEQDLIDANNQMEQLCECSIRLPVDADGEVIHIGDRVENNERVVRIVLTDGSWEPSVYVEKLPNVLHEYFCNEISHHHEPTVEDVLREFAEKVIDSQIPSVHPTYEEAITEYAAKLRLAEVVDE